uniref:Uncharacterized protein n=1 Tax=Romanomermis culicivorax TaxID=13658 RepID=A0A915KPW3_ROMCU
MADFEEAPFIPSLHGRMPMVVCESGVNPDYIYLLKKVKRLVIGGEVMYFECISCNSHRNPMGSATVHEGKVQSNLDHGHNPLCVPLTLPEVEAKRIKQYLSETEKQRKKTSN